MRIEQPSVVVPRVFSCPEAGGVGGVLLTEALLQKAPKEQITSPMGGGGGGGKDHGKKTRIYYGKTLIYYFF